MHVGNDGILRWRRGRAPASRAAGKLNIQSGKELHQKKRKNEQQAKERIQFPESFPKVTTFSKDLSINNKKENKNNIQDVITTTNGVRKKTLKTIKDFYRDSLDTTQTITLGKVQHTDKVGKLLPLIQMHMIKSLIKCPDSYDVLSSVITDYRLNSGELPRQEIGIESKQSHHHEHDFSGLIEAADAILSRRRSLPKPDNQADNGIIEECEVIEIEAKNTNNKDLSQ